MVESSLSSQPDPYLLRLEHLAVGTVFLLALVCEAVAVSAQTILAGQVQRRHTSVTFLSVHHSGADEPRSLAAVVAAGPGQSDGLVYILPLATRGAKTVNEDQTASLNKYVYGSHLLAVLGPYPGKLGPRV